MNKKILYPVAIGMAINLVLPKMAKPFATPEEIKPDDPQDLSFKSKVMHIMVHHDQLPISSTLVVGLIVGLSVYIGGKIK